MEYNNLNKIYKTDFLDLYHCDCMELLRQTPDNYYSLALVDPPYGHNAMDGSRTRKKYGINRGDNWDCYRPDKTYFNELQRVSKNQIVWGGNYFITDLTDTKCFIIWDKKIAEGMEAILPYTVLKNKLKKFLSGNLEDIPESVGKNGKSKKSKKPKKSDA